MLDLRVRLYRPAARHAVRLLRQQKPGEAVSHVLNDVQGVGGVVSGTLVDLVQNSVVLGSTLAFRRCASTGGWRCWRSRSCRCFIGSARRVGRQRKQLKRIAAGAQRAN